MKCNRRTFLMALGAPALPSFAKGVPGPLGLELYSLRRDMLKDVPKTLAFARRLGFAEVEVPGLYGLTSAQFRQDLDRAGLKCTAMVADDKAIRAGIPGVVDQARTFGATYVIYPWIQHGKTFEASDCERAAEDFNRWGEQFHAAGLQFGYHPHGYEFGPSPDGTLLDTMLRLTASHPVLYELDTFWFAWPGQDPVKYLKRYPGRFPLMHLKDLRKGAKGNQTGSAPDELSVAVGSGEIDFPAIFRAAREARVKRYYIEDESPRAPEQVPASLRYLRSLVL